MWVILYKMPRNVMDGYVLKVGARKGLGKWTIGSANQYGITSCGVAGSNPAGLTLDDEVEQVGTGWKIVAQHTAK